MTECISPPSRTGNHPGTSIVVTGWWRLILWDLFIAAVWAVMRERFCLMPNGTCERFLTFNAPMPFAARLLAPCLAWPLDASGWLPGRQAFLFVDALGFLGFLSGVRYALRALVPAPAALLGSLVIPLMLVPAVFIAAEERPLFFPYDMTSIAFIAWGLGFALRRKPVALALLMPFATLNRETAILLPIAWVFLWWDRLPALSFLKTTGFISLAFVVPRALVLFITRDHRNSYGSSVPLVEKGNWIIDNNVGWLLHPVNVVLWCALLGFVPLLLIALRGHLPDVSKRLIPLLAFQLTALFFCGILDESRIYGEWIVIAGVILAPAAMSACSAPLALGPYLEDEPRPGLRTVSTFFAKYALALMFMAAAVAYVGLHLSYNR